MSVGKVYLVGAAPGDPGLMTLKGKTLLECADVVIYDALVSPQILESINPQAERIDAGKTSRQAFANPRRNNSVINRKSSRQCNSCSSQRWRSVYLRSWWRRNGRFGQSWSFCRSRSRYHFWDCSPCLCGNSFNTSIVQFFCYLCYRSRISRKISTRGKLAGDRPRLRNHCNIHGDSQFTIHHRPINRSRIECRNAHSFSALGNALEQEELIGMLSTIVEQVETTGFAAPAIAVIGNVVNLHGLLSGCRPVYQTVE